MGRQSLHNCSINMAAIQPQHWIQTWFELLLENPSPLLAYNLMENGNQTTPGKTSTNLHSTKIVQKQGPVVWISTSYKYITRSLDSLLQPTEHSNERFLVSTLWCCQNNQFQSLQHSWWGVHSRLAAQGGKNDIQLGWKSQGGSGMPAVSSCNFNSSCLSWFPGTPRAPWWARCAAWQLPCAPWLWPRWGPRVSPAASWLVPSSSTGPQGSAKGKQTGKLNVTYHLARLYQGRNLQTKAPSYPIKIQWDRTNQFGDCSYEVRVLSCKCARFQVWSLWYDLASIKLLNYLT